MNTLKATLLALGSAIALVIVFGGVMFYLITCPSPVSWSTTPPPMDPEAANQFDERMDIFRQELDEASAGEQVTLTLVEEEVTSKLNQLAVDNRLPANMDRVSLHFRYNLIQGASVANLWFKVEVAFEATITMHNGKPELQITKLYLGRLPIPKTLTDNVIAALANQINKRLEDLPVEISDIVIDHGVIIIVTKTKGVSNGTLEAGYDRGRGPFVSSISVLDETGSRAD